MEERAAFNLRWLRAREIASTLSPYSVAANRAARTAASWSGERSAATQAGERLPYLPAMLTCWAALRRALAAFRTRRRTSFARPLAAARLIRLRPWSER